MATVKVTSLIATKAYEFEGNDFGVIGEVRYNPTTSVLQSVSGVFHEKAEEGQGAYVGYFEGFYQEGELKYGINEITSENAALVIGTVSELESYLQQIIQQEVSPEG